MRRALTELAIRRERRGAVIFGFVFAVFAVSSALGYSHSFETAAERSGFARTFMDDRSVRFLFGTPHDLATTAGFCAWRVGGVVAVVGAAWAALGGVRESRGEEEVGRADLVLAGGAGRGAQLGASLIALAAGIAAAAALLAIGLAASGLPVAGSAYLALAALSPAPVFATAGLLAGQIAPDRHRAAGLVMAAIGFAFAARVVADTAAELSWLRWVTPLGWAEELRPLTGARPAVLVLPVATTAALAAAVARIVRARDVGRGLLSVTDRRAPRDVLLGSPTALALREARGRFAAWGAGMGIFAVLIGALSTSFTAGDVKLQDQLSDVGGGSLSTPIGALSFYFLFFALAIAFFAATQVAGLRREEALGRLETLFAQPVGRVRWVAGRLLLAAAAATVLMLATGALTWVGATLAGADVALADLLAAGLNCVPLTLLFLALGALVFALAPRATAGLIYGLVGLGFLWELVGGLVGVPAWVRSLSPFHHLALVPVEAFDAADTAGMLAVAAVAAAVALRGFARRDLAGA